VSDEKHLRNSDEAASRGWDIFSFECLRTLPEWLAAAVYVLATLLIAYVLYMIGLGLFAFTKLGHEIASGYPGGAAPVKNDGGGSLTVFFTVLAALIGGPLVIWRVVTSHLLARAAQRQAEIAQETSFS
jgi:hypothetical protein